MRTYITKSKSGHYTVTVRSAAGVFIRRFVKLPNLGTAQQIVKAVKSGVPFDQIFY